MRAFPALPPVRTALDAFTPAQLASLVQRFLDANPTYHASTINSYPIITPEEPGTVAQPRAGRCWTFDGSNDYATLGSRLAAQNELTVAVWFRPGSSSGIHAIASNIGGSGNNCDYQLEFNRTAGKLSFLRRGTAVAAVSTGSLSIGTLYHVAVVVSGSSGNWSIKFYINGVLDSTTAYALDSDGDGTSIFSIGRAGGYGGSYLNGSLKDILIDDEAYTAGEVLSLYNTHQVPSGKTPLAFYRCEEESGTTGYNSISNDNHLTLTRITQATFHATDTGVKYSHCNAKGYTLSGSVVIPASLSTPTQDAAGNALGVTGPVAYPATVEVPCVTGDGSAAYVDLGSGLIPATTTYLDISFVIRRNQNESRGQLYQGTTGNAFGVEVFPTVLYVVCGGTTIYSQVTHGMNTTSWYAVRVVYDGSLAGNSNRLKVYLDGVLQSLTFIGSIPASISPSGTMTLLKDVVGGYSYASLSDFRITTGGVTTYFPLQDGPGTSNTNRDLAYCKSDGTGGVVGGAIVSGTVSTIWANRCPFAQDWSIQYGGSYNPNMLSYSEQFDNGAWGKVAVGITPDQASSPIGSGADLVTASSSGSYRYVLQVIPLIKGTTYNVSCYFKAGTAQWVWLLGEASGDSLQYFDLQNGVVGGTSGASGITGAIESLGNGWYRCSATFTKLSATSTEEMGWGISDANGSPAVTVGKTVYAHAAQLKPGSVATPYQASTTAGVFIPGRIGSANDAAGNAKTLAAGKHGNPYSRLNRNRWSAPELVNIGITSSDAVAPSTNVQAASVVDTQFRRAKADGSDRYFATRAALTGTDKTNAESYVG